MVKNKWRVLLDIDCDNYNEVCDEVAKVVILLQTMKKSKTLNIVGLEVKPRYDA